MTSTFIELIDSHRYCPASIQRVVYNDLRVRLGSEYIPADITSPYAHSIETSANLVHAAMTRNDLNNRAQYQKVATTEQDIYRHMSDVDYIGRFAMPGSTHVYVAFPITEIKNKAIVDQLTGIRKLTIGRHSMFQISGVTLGIHYPIEIRLLPSGNLQVVYDTAIESPLQTLTSNLVEHSVREFGGIQYLEMKIPVFQFLRETHMEVVTQATGFRREYPIKNEFYHCRVYNADAAGNWNELKTTHSTEVYSSSEPTAVLTRLNGKLVVHFPQIYLTNGKLKGKIRIDVFTTRGPMELDLSEYRYDEYGVRWDELDDRFGGIYTSPTNNLNDIIIYSDGRIQGGRKELTFQELQERSIKNTNGKGVPITIDQLNELVGAGGFNVIMTSDDITDRRYLMTAKFPTPKGHDTRTPIGSNLELIQVNESVLHSLSTVKHNEVTTTILDTTLYEKSSGRLVPLSDSVVAKINSMNAEDRVTYINNRDLLYSPFHYSIDGSGTTLTVRPFYLNNPKIVSRRFANENVSTALQCSTGSIRLTKVPEGFRFDVITASSADVQALADDKVILQASITPSRETRQAYQIAKLEGRSDKERVFSFVIKTDYLFNKTSDLYVTSMDMFSDDELSHAIELLTDMNLYYIVDDEYVPSSDFDDELGAFQLPDNAHGLSHEVVKVKFGSYLERLRCRHRPVPQEVAYRRYEADVYETWDRDVIDRNEKQEPLWDIVDGRPQARIKHHKGDYVLDDSGQKKLLHKAGSVIYDPYTGKPEPIYVPDNVYQFEITLLDATYLYCTESVIKSYLTEIPALIAKWVEEDAVIYNQQLLEQTRMYVSPTRSAGEALVSVTDGDKQSIPAEQSLVVQAFVDSSVYENAKLRAQITNTIKDIINVELGKPVISIPDIQTLLKNSISELNAVTIQGLGPERNMHSIKVIGSGDALSIRKTLVLEPSGAISLRDDINVGFVKQTL